MHLPRSVFGRVAPNREPQTKVRLPAAPQTAGLGRVNRRLTTRQARDQRPWPEEPKERRWQVQREPPPLPGGRERNRRPPVPRQQATAGPQATHQRFRAPRRRVRNVPRTRDLHRDWPIRWRHEPTAQASNLDRLHVVDTQTCTRGRDRRRRPHDRLGRESASSTTTSPQADNEWRLHAQ